MELISRKISTEDTRETVYSDNLALVAVGEAELEEQLIEWKDIRQTWTESKFGEDGGDVGGAGKEEAGKIPGWIEA